MTEQFLGEIRLCSFPFAPKNWALCNGQLLTIAQNQALFSLLGTAYGGNGTSTFALPDLRGRRAVHTGQSFTLGSAGGVETVTLTSAQMPVHAHVPQAAAAGTGNAPTSNVWAPLPGGYAPAADSALDTACVAQAGGGSAHENMPPFLTLNFVIALTGLFPSRP
nr:tail fiber protein [Dactylosporangium thailandense]